MAALPKVDWSARLAADWQSLAEQTAAQHGLDPAALLRELPIPKGIDLKNAGAAIELVATLLDGPMNAAKTAQIVKLIGSAIAGLASGAAIGTLIPIPLLGTAAGAVAGFIVGEIIDTFFGGDAERQAKKKFAKQRAETVKNIKAWEKDALDASWKSLLFAVSFGTPSEDISLATIESFDRKVADLEDVRVAAPFVKHTTDTLNDWGWTIKPGKKSPNSWQSIQAFYDGPYPDSMTEAQRNNAWKAAVDRRIELHARILARWNAYLAQLSAIRSAIDQTIEKANIPKAASDAAFRASKLRLTFTGLGAVNMRAGRLFKRIGGASKGDRKSRASGGGLAVLVLASGAAILMAKKLR